MAGRAGHARAICELVQAGGLAGWRCEVGLEAVRAASRLEVEPSLSVLDYRLREELAACSGCLENDVGRVVCLVVGGVVGMGCAEVVGGWLSFRVGRGAVEGGCGEEERTE